MKSREEKFEYAVAISFAEEDRNAALALALAMEISKLGKVYYYPDNLDATTGKNLDDELASVYAERAAYAVVLLSPRYFDKPYTRIEFAAIRQRMLQSPDKVYLLPVMLEKTDMNDFPDLKKLGYLTWDHEPKKIAALMRKVFGMPIKNPQPGYAARETIVQAIQKVINHDRADGQVITNIAKIRYGK